MTLFETPDERPPPECRVDGCTDPPTGTGKSAAWCVRHQPRPIDGNVAPIGRYHPPHARRAAARALPRSGSKRRLVYEWVKTGRRYTGATAEEIGDHFGWEHQSYSPTVSTLASDGYLVPLCENGEPVLRPTRSGNEAQVYVVDVL